MLHCHIVLTEELPEALCQFVVRHLTELIAEGFRMPRDNVAIRVDTAPPARYFVGGHLHSRPETCLVTLICPPGELPDREFSASALCFLRATFGPTVLDSQILIIETRPASATANIMD